MNTEELIQNKKFNHKKFCILYSIFFAIAWLMLKYVAEYNGNEVRISNMVFITLFTIIIIVILAFAFTEIEV